MVTKNVELGNSANKLCRELLLLKKGENVLIYADNESDYEVVEATMEAAYSIGAEVTAIIYPAPPDVGEEAEKHIPKNVKNAIINSEVLVEFAKKYLLYSKTWYKAMEKGARYLCLTGMDKDMMIRCIGKVDYENMLKLGDKLIELTKKANSMKIISKSGTNVYCELDKKRPIVQETGICKGPGAYFLGGQIWWAPIEETINGSIVFDGSIWPPSSLGILKNPIKLIIKNGKIIEILGKEEARIFSDWLKKWEDKNMYNIAHYCYGFNPGAKLSGLILEDERVFGCIEIGIGHQSDDFLGNAGHAKAHTDGIILNPSIWLDDEKIEENGNYIHSELFEICKKIKFLSD